MKNRGGKSRYTIPFMNGGKRRAYFLFRFLVLLLTLMTLHFKETMLLTLHFKETMLRTAEGNDADGVTL